MKKRIAIIASCALASALAISCPMSAATVNAAPQGANVLGTKSASNASTPVAQHGALSVKKTSGFAAPTIVDKNGNPVQLHGISTHGVQWFPEYINKDSFRSLRDDWGIDTVRLALYARENGYTQGSKDLMDKKIDEAVSAAKELGMYVIIDWHVLNYNPNEDIDAATQFFTKYANKYKNVDNVIFEIANEPTSTNWYDGSGKDLYTYSKTVAGAIRKTGAKNIIICGTNDWSQRVDQVADKPLKDDGFENIMYTVHFYAATHYDNIKDNVRKAVKAGTPVICTEFGVCDASGNGGYDFANADDWMKLFSENNISFALWSLCNKNESASVISSSCSKTSGWTESDLTESGKWLMKTCKSLAGKSNTGNTNTGKTEDKKEDEKKEDNNKQEERKDDNKQNENNGQNNNQNNGQNNGQNTPAPTPTPTPAPQPETRPATGDKVDFDVVSDWDFGFSSNNTFRNTSNSAVDGWTVEFDSNADISEIWNAKIVSHKGNHYVIQNESYNGFVAPGSTVSFGFNGKKANGAKATFTNVTIR